MMHFGRFVRLAVVLAVGLVYLGVVWLGLTEEKRRSLIFTKDSTSSADYVIINVRVTAMDPVLRLLHERIRIIPMGRFAIDKATPAVDLKLLINSVSGKQTILYPKGERIGPIDFTSPLIGNLNRYPFDRYTADIDLVVTAPAPPARPEPRATRAIRAPRASLAAPTPSTPPVPTKPSAPATSSAPATLSASTAPSASTTPSGPEAAPATEGALEASDDDPMIITSLVVGPSDLHKSEAVSIQENFVAAIAGVKFEGKTSEDDTFKLMRTSLVMRRADNVISISIIVMTVMFILAISVMVMALRVTTAPNEINLIPLSLCVTLIFGLPALRNTQPGVPGVGALCDYLSFIWAELIVSTSAIGLAWTWIVRSIELQKRTK